MEYEEIKQKYKAQASAHRRRVELHNATCETLEAVIKETKRDLDKLAIGNCAITAENARKRNTLAQILHDLENKLADKKKKFAEQETKEAINQMFK